MYRNKINWIVWPLFILTAVFSAWGFKQTEDDKGVSNTVAIFREGAAGFAAASLELEQAIHAIDASQPGSITEARTALKKCRGQYKRIEFFLDYFFFSSSLVYNRPAKTEIDEPYMEYQAPAGLQQMEALLYDKDPVSRKKELQEEAAVISSSAADLPALLYQFHTTDKSIMESIRIELVRLYANGITGYDAPQLKSGISETCMSMQTILAVLQPWLSTTSPENIPVKNYLTQCIQYLQQHPDFDTFNRLGFLTSCALPLQEQLGKLITALQLDQHTRSALNYNAKNLFSKDALNPAVFPDSIIATPALKALGQQLFFEKALSGNNTRNCASCHQPAKYFSDGFKTSLTLDGREHVRRNAPSLYYAGFQYAQFWDGRAHSLSKQIADVISNPQEMNGIHAVVISRLRDSAVYRTAFNAAFSGTHSTDTAAITLPHLSAAIAAYLSSLAPMSSAMDDYFAGNRQAMTPAQINGFNLFMGKAQCATCHFAPLFNGLTPPFYQFTEFENLGMPANDDLLHPQTDHDEGRFEFFPIDFYKRAFKTPTVRNSAMTAPYMHNGAFADLEKVMEFYNAGGGNGLGMEDPYQTLSPVKLGLTPSEIQDVIAFLHALTDRPVAAHNE
jgi:cytochrome c peroxidase